MCDRLRTRYLVYKMHLSASTTSSGFIYDCSFPQCEICTKMQHYTGDEEMDKWLEKWVDEIMENWNDEVIS